MGEYAGNGQGEVENATDKVSPPSTDLDYYPVDTDKESVEDEMGGDGMGGKLEHSSVYMPSRRINKLGK